MIAGNRLARAWLVLIAFSAASALLTTGILPLSSRIAGLCLLTLACAKARVILADYLGLRVSAAWLSGFTTVIAIYVAALAAFFLMG